MKNSITKHILPLALLLIIIGSLGACKKLLDINTDPNNAPLDKATPEVLFPSAVASTAGRIGGEYAILGGIWAQFWTQSATASQYRNFDSYNVTQADLNGSFVETYSGALNDYQYIIKLANEDENWRFLLMATVMKAYTYQVMVDLYDQMPYDEAFQGEANITPHYENGDVIYNKLLAEIDTALSRDYNAGADVGAPDVVFGGGNMEPWVRFAHTLKLKMFLREVYAKPDEAEAGIRALYDEDALFLTQDAAMDIFQNLPDKSNPLFEFNFRKLNINTNLRASRTLLTFLQEYQDPRTAFLYTPSAPDFVGINQGDYTNPDPALAGVSIAIVNATDPVHFISTAESYFLQAEARERYYGGDGALELYNSGVAAAFDQYGLGTDAAAFTAPGKPYAYPAIGNFEQKLEAIIVQKWLSLPGSHALEAFFEKNRTGYPKSSPVYSTDPSYIPGQLVYPKTGTTGGKYPKRLIIAEDERKTNPNVPAIKPITENVWWDKK